MSNLDVIREKLDGGKFTDLQELAEGLLAALESIEHYLYSESPFGEEVAPDRIIDAINFYAEELATVPETCAHETYRATLETPAEGCEEDAVEGSEYCEEHSR